jgi:hypothetical protein
VSKKRKRQKPNLKVASKSEFLTAMSQIDDECLYPKWAARPDDNHFFLALDVSQPYSSYMAEHIGRTFPQYQQPNSAWDVDGRVWVVMLVADDLIDRLLELPFENIEHTIGEWFHRIKGKRPTRVPLLGCSIIGKEGERTEFWRIEYEPDPADPIPSLN